MLGFWVQWDRYEWSWISRTSGYKLRFHPLVKVKTHDPIYTKDVTFFGRGNHLNEYVFYNVYIYNILLYIYILLHGKGWQPKFVGGMFIGHRLSFAHINMEVHLERDRQQITSPHSLWVRPIFSTAGQVPCWCCSVHDGSKRKMNVLLEIFRVENGGEIGVLFWFFCLKHFLKSKDVSNCCWKMVNENACDWS